MPATNKKIEKAIIAFMRDVHRKQPETIQQMVDLAWSHDGEIDIGDGPDVIDGVGDYYYHSRDTYEERYYGGVPRAPNGDMLIGDDEFMAEFDGEKVWFRVVWTKGDLYDVIRLERFEGYDDESD